VSVHFLTKDLARWDESPGEALVLTFFVDERPLRGAAGLADWRLCGRLSNLIKGERITGVRGEQLLLPPGRRLSFSRLLLFGLGDSFKFSEETYRQHVRWIRDVVHRAGLASYALQPPGRATGVIGARRALELWLEESEKARREEDVAVIDTPGGQKEMAEILRYHGKRSEP
jgi:hypothetical protein